MIFRNTYKLIILTCSLLFCPFITSQGQTQMLELSATIVNQAGDPINNVGVFGEKSATASSDDNGVFTIKVERKSYVIIKKDGYETKLLAVSEIDKEIELVKSDFLMSAKDEVNLGFRSKKKKRIVGAVNSIRPSDYAIYDNSQDLNQIISGRLLGLKGTSNVRGLGAPVYVIDGVLGRDPDMLNISEVEEITLLKDANASALYGTAGENGVIVITTKKGDINQRKSNVSINYGIKSPISYPEYLDAADYMDYYNLALSNDGKPDLYSSDLIDNTRQGDKPYRYPNVDLYSDEYLNRFAQTANVVAEFSGGNEKTQYYVNMGWNMDGSIEKYNPEANKGSNTFNVRGNVDFKISNFIKSTIGASAIIGTNKHARASVLSSGTTFKPNSYAPLLPVGIIDSTLQGVLSTANQFDGSIIGGSQSVSDNPIGTILAGGYENDVARSLQFNNTIDFDLRGITKGLSAKTFVSIDMYDAYALQINNDYMSYQPNTWNNDKITKITSLGVDNKDQTENVITDTYSSRYSFSGQLDYTREFAQKHLIDATFLGYLNLEQVYGTIQSNNVSHLALNLNYGYKDKVLVDLSAAYSHSIKLSENQRDALSPTLGLAYVLSEENFLKNNSVIDYLKIRMSGGLINTDVSIGNLLYQDTYLPGNAYSWNNEGWDNKGTISQRGRNNNLMYEKRIDFNIGAEAMFLQSLWVDFNVFQTEKADQVVQLNNQYPSFYSEFTPYKNYNRNKYRGVELGLTYTKQFDEVYFEIGTHMLYTASEVVDKWELFEDEELKRVGKPVDALFALEDDGLYTEADFVNGALLSSLPKPSYSEVQVGDIKYKNTNGDNIINDDDQTMLGRKYNPFDYSLNIRLKYKNWSLFMLGTGQAGGTSMRSNAYYWVNGNDKYSTVVEDSWTPNNLDASYPRLSTTNNSNNFRNSSFWSYNNSYLKLKRAQLTYEFDDKISKKLGTQNLSVNFIAYNLFELSKNKDIRQLNIGGNPQYRTYTLGVRASF